MKIADCEATLIDSMGTDISVVNAARVSFNKKSYYLFDDDDPSIEYMHENDLKLLKYLAQHKHWSPFTHTSLSFRIKAPIFVARQLAKHQIGLSWNEISRRYVDTEPEFYFPEKWRTKADNVKQGSSDLSIKELTIDPINLPTVEYDGFNSKDLCSFLLDWYKLNIKNGMCAEQARMILPLNIMTEWIWTGNVYSFARVCKLRLDSHTQKETQSIAKLISNLIYPRFPESWNVLMETNENL